MKLKLTCILLTILLTVQCQKNTEKILLPEFGYEFYPHQIGQFSIFNVTQYYHNDFTQTIDTINFQRKILLADTFTNLAGNLAYKAEQFLRNTLNDNWELEKIFSIVVLPTRVEVNNENITTVNLIFPARKGQKWNGYAFNNLGEQIFEILTEIPDSLVKNAHPDELLLVKQYQTENILEKSASFEMYQPVVGLVYKHYEFLNLQKDSGIISFQWLVEFGNQ